MRHTEFDFSSLAAYDAVLVVVLCIGLTFVKIGYGMYRKIAGIENSGDMPIISFVAYIYNTYIYKAQNMNSRVGYIIYTMQ